LFKAADIGTRGTMMRIYAQNPQVATVINYSHSNSILNPAIIADMIKQLLQSLILTIVLDF
jgi:hypothetical protein